MCLQGAALLCKKKKEEKKGANTGYLLFKESLKLLMYDSKLCCQGMAGGLYLSPFNHDGFQLRGESFCFMTDE